LADIQKTLSSVSRGGLQPSVCQSDSKGAVGFKHLADLSRSFPDFWTEIAWEIGPIGRKIAINFSAEFVIMHRHEL
jgi:hypothetical protein